MTPPPPDATPPVQYHQHVKNNGLAVASLVLGLVGIFTFALLAIPPILAVIFGLVGRNQIRKSGGRQSGEGMALAGIILGAIETVVFVILLASGGSFYFRFG
jgi:hypothetical protein